MPVLAPAQRVLKRVGEHLEPGLEEFQEVFWNLVTGIRRRLIGKELEEFAYHLAGAPFTWNHVTHRRRQVRDGFIYEPYMNFGHIIVQGPPGVGKTRAMLILSALIGGENQKIQFHPELTPKDLIGFELPVRRSNDGIDFVFRPGPIETDVLLADEINRGTTKVQAALLEPMTEGVYTVGREARFLNGIYLVVATQNTLEGFREGTYALPSPQLDRFTKRLFLHRLSQEELMELPLLEMRVAHEPISPVTTIERMLVLREWLSSAVEVPPLVLRYMARLVLAPGEEESLGFLAGLRKGLDPGSRLFDRENISGRGMNALFSTSRVAAAAYGSKTVLPDHVAHEAFAVLNHRIPLTREGRSLAIQEFGSEEAFFRWFIEELLKEVRP